MHLCKDLGFDKTDRDENIRRIGFVAELLSRNGVITIVAAISAYRSTRQEIRSSVQRFVEVYVNCPISVLIARDTKGMYKKALAGEISHFTGVSDPYEPPLSPELVIDTSSESPNQSAARIWDKLCELGLTIRPICAGESEGSRAGEGSACRSNAFGSQCPNSPC
jgi:adenylyl-sulfate kinase